MTIEQLTNEFELVRPQLKSYILRITASVEDAEDIVQDSFIKASQKIDTFRGGSSVKTWIFTIARNLRIDRLRRESSVYFTDLENFDAPSDEAPDDEALNRSQEDAHVARALAQIPPEQRELLILSYVEDVPQSMIAERLKLPLGTVKSRMRLAYRRMRKLLEAVN